MMHISIIKSQYDLLVQKTSIGKLFVSAVDEKDYLIKVTGDEASFRVLSDELVSLIASEGISDSGEINVFGLSIERIIDDILTRFDY